MLDAEDYKTFQELKAKNQELEHQLTEALKYKALQSHAEHAHLRAKVSDLESKLNRDQPSASSGHGHTTSTETLEAKPEQTGLGGNESIISVNTIEENIFKKSLQKRDFGGLIIEGNFDMEIFMKRGISLKEILEDDTLFKPKRRDLMKEENIVFHSNGHNLGIEDVKMVAGDEL